MAIFNSYVSLPEGRYRKNTVMKFGPDEVRCRRKSVGLCLEDICPQDLDKPWLGQFKSFVINPHLHFSLSLYIYTYIPLSLILYVCISIYIYTEYIYIYIINNNIYTYTVYLQDLPTIQKNGGLPVAPCHLPLGRVRPGGRWGSTLALWIGWEKRRETIVFPMKTMVFP